MKYLKRFTRGPLTKLNESSEDLSGLIKAFADDVTRYTDKYITLDREHKEAIDRLDAEYDKVVANHQKIIKEVVKECFLYLMDIFKYREINCGKDRIHYEITDDKPRLKEFFEELEPTLYRLDQLEVNYFMKINGHGAKKSWYPFSDGWIKGKASENLKVIKDIINPNLNKFEYIVISFEIPLIEDIDPHATEDAMENL